MINITITNTYIQFLETQLKLTTKKKVAENINIFRHFLVYKINLLK